uniref:INO-like YABBY protein n=1 Tax=Cabomba caroliniana TaxID=4426 RepID=E9RFE7_CABCA|nr:INO-like YABBY protein [Cabomba caroliniana]
MSACNQIIELTEQLCYVQCSFCDTILLVSVPCSSLLKVVPIGCGHCGNLFSVNMLKTSLVPVHLLTSLNNEQGQESSDGDTHLKNGDNSLTASLYGEERRPSFTVNKPPEKRHRAPSAYNRFIKEEIQRLKANDPSITHREAFSTAAKNWAHLPRFQHKTEGATESESLKQGTKAKGKHIDQEILKQGNQCFQQRKVSRQSLSTRTPFE